MSEPILEIYDSKNILEIETNIGNITNSLEIETSTNQNIDIISDSIGGFISAMDILALDNYIYNYIDSSGILSSQINDFNSSVSGLLPVKDIINGNGIEISSSSGIYTIDVTGNFGLTSEEVDDRVGELLISGDYIKINYNDNINKLIISATGLQPSGIYASGVHYHISDDIINFNSSVSGLIPSLSGISGIVVTNSGTSNIISLVDPLIQLIDIIDLSSDARNFLNTPSSNNLLSLVTDKTGSGILVFNTSPNFSGIPTVPTADSGNNSNQIANTSFVRNEISYLVNSAPSTLDTLNELANALGNDANFATTITSGLAQKSNIGHHHEISDISGLQNTLDSKQPSGIYASGIHNHISEDITDFDISVSGLLPVKNITQGSGIKVESNFGDYIISVTGNFGLTSEEVDDRVSELLSDGSYISLNYDDINNKLLINVTGLQPSGNYSLVGHSHSIDNINGLQLALDNKQPSGNYSIVGHSHVILDISGLQNALDNKQPSGNYSVIGHSHLLSDISGLQNALDNKQPSGVYASGTHYHIVNDITDFNSGVSGLLPSVNGSGYINSNFNNNTYTISVSGLQPSGNYSVIGHSHIISEISGLQTELDNKQELLTNPITGSGSFNHIAYWTSTSGLSYNDSQLYWDSLSYELGIGTNNPAYKLDVVGTGNFSQNLLVNNIPVSVSGHTHISNDITDFNTSVSGLLPKIANSGDNRILTSTGTTVGINAESNLTFDGSTLSVSGTIIGNSGIIDYIDTKKVQFDTDTNGALVTGQLGWNSTVGTLDIGLTDTYALHIGEETHFRIRNLTGSTLYKGQAVQATGVFNDNQRLLVNKYTADGSVREIRFIGLMTENVDHNQSGYTTNFGYIKGVDTRGNVASDIAVGDETWAVGDILYVHPTVAGKLTKVEPKHSISVAIILYVHQNNGLLLVRPTSYGHLNDIHDVNISGATNGQFLQYNSSTDYWVPSSSGNFTTLQLNGTTVSVSGHKHITSDVLDFVSGVSGIIEDIVDVVVVGSGGVAINYIEDQYVLSVSGDLSANSGTFNYLNVSGDITASHFSPTNNTITTSKNNIKQSDYYININTSASTDFYNLLTENDNDLFLENNQNIITERLNPIPLFYGSESIPINSGSLMQYNLKINSFDSINDLSSSFNIRGFVKRNNSGISFIGSPIKESWKDIGSENTDVYIISNNNDLIIQTSGSDLQNKELYWAGVLNIVESTI